MYPLRKYRVYNYEGRENVKNYLEEKGISYIIEKEINETTFLFKSEFKIIVELDEIEGNCLACKGTGKVEGLHFDEIESCNNCLGTGKY